MFKRDPKRDHTGILWEYAQTFRRSDSNDPGMVHRVALVFIVVIVIVIAAALGEAAWLIAS